MVKENEGIRCMAGAALGLERKSRAGEVHRAFVEGGGKDLAKVRSDLNCGRRVYARPSPRPT
eukprot:1586275-Lingulodinium_polyedra.AAC.1